MRAVAWEGLRNRLDIYNNNNNNDNNNNNNNNNNSNKFLSNTRKKELCTVLHLKRIKTKFVP